MIIYLPVVDKCVSVRLACLLFTFEYFRLLPFTWIRDTFMPAEDPLGRGGPRLKDFLQF